MAKIEDLMSGIGIGVVILVCIGILALLIYHFNWWVIPAIASAIVLRWLIKKY